MSKRKALYDELTDGSVNFKEWCENIFFFPTGDGIRISTQGIVYLNHYLTPYTIDSSDYGSARLTKHLTFLAKFCKRPYRVGLNTITFYSEEEAFVFKLCDGDVDNVKEVAGE